MALNKYIDHLAELYKMSEGEAKVWKVAMKKSEKVRRMYKCGKEHLNHVARIRHIPQWQMMCKTNRTYQYLDDVVTEPQEIFVFDELELN